MDWMLPITVTLDISKYKAWTAVNSETKQKSKTLEQSKATRTLGKVSICTRKSSSLYWLFGSMDKSRGWRKSNKGNDTWGSNCSQTKTDDKPTRFRKKKFRTTPTISGSHGSQREMSAEGGMILFLQTLDNFDNTCVAVEEFNRHP